MRATIMYKAGNVRIETVPDAQLLEPTDAVLRISRACICGSDLWPYKALEAVPGGKAMGHEAIGVVEALGSAVRGFKRGDLVVMPFAYSDGTCEYCHDGLQSACAHGGFFGDPKVGGAQAEAVRVPLADGTLYRLPVGEDDALLPGLLTLSDVMGTGYHAALAARVRAGSRVAVIGDGAVGLCGVIAAKLLGAEQIMILGRHPARLELAKDFGATDIVTDRGESAIEQVRKLTRGHGVHSVLECVGTEDAMRTAILIARAGGAVGRVGVPHYQGTPESDHSFYKNITVGGGPAPVRAYIDTLLPHILDGRIQPGRVFDQTVSLDEVPAGYRSMNDRSALKVMIRP
jgi:threonine dehydrogenase-like Zn-dependent dehydrogenase